MAPSFTTIPQYIEALNRFFERRGIPLHLSASDLTFTSDIVTDALKQDPLVSGYLTAKLSPPIPEGIFYHYTTRDGLEKILRSGVLRLTSVKKRIGDDEIRDFLKRFGFKHPQGIDPNSNTPRYHTTLANEIFYLSLTDAATTTGAKDSTLWNNFAFSDGARLKLRLKLNSGCLRRMVYGDQVDELVELFREVSDITVQQLGKTFFWADAGTVCALQLPGTYNSEEETRLITRRGCGLNLSSEGEFEFLEAKFGENPAIALNLELLEIQTNRPISNSLGAIVIPRGK